MAPEKSTVGAKVSPNLKEDIEQYQEDEGFANTSDAVRDLIQTGLEKKQNPSGTIPVPAAVMWFGTMIFMIGVEPGPATSGDSIMVAGLVVFLVGLLLGRTNLLAQLGR